VQGVFKKMSCLLKSIFHCFLYLGGVSLLCLKTTNVQRGVNIKVNLRKMKVGKFNFLKSSFLAFLIFLIQNANYFRPKLLK
jgi:hypothetical protein